LNLKIIPDVVGEHDPITLKKNRSVGDAVQTMSTANISAVAVTNDDDQLIGIITGHDITHRVLACKRDPQATVLADVMTQNPEALLADDLCLDAIELMLTRNIRHLPVVDEHRRVIAMVSMRDVLRVALGQFNADIQDAQQHALGPQERGPQKH